MARSVARLLATAALWVRIHTSLKNPKWATFSKEWPTHSSPPKNIQKESFLSFFTLDTPALKLIFPQKNTETLMTKRRQNVQIQFIFLIHIYSKQTLFLVHGNSMKLVNI